MNIVYVLVSTEEDFYYEQTIVSILSVIKNVPDSNIHLLVDDRTYKTFVNHRKYIFGLQVNIVIVDVPENYNNKDSSRYLKTSMNQNVDGDFLYIDGDTIICENIHCDDFDMDIGGVLDKHYLLSNHPSIDSIKKRADKCGYHTGYDDMHFNSGVMWVKSGKTSDDFFSLWHKLWKEARENGVTQDQASLNEANFRLGGIISELDGVWNCQLSNRTAGLQYVFAGKIIHYFASYGHKGVPYDLANAEILRSVLHDVPDIRLNDIIENPKAAFRTVSYLSGEEIEADICESQMFKLLKEMYIKRKWMYSLINKKAHIINVLKRSFSKNS